MSFNTSSKVSTYKDEVTGKNGVILPHSSQILYEHDLDSKIQKAKSQINLHASNQSSKRNHRGKRHRAKQLANKDLVDASSQRLADLMSAKKILANQNRTREPKSPIDTFLPMPNFEGYFILERSPYAALFAQSAG